MQTGLAQAQGRLNIIRQAFQTLLTLRCENTSACLYHDSGKAVPHMVHTNCVTF